MQRWILLVLLGCAVAFTLILRRQQIQIEQSRDRLEEYMRSAEGLGEITITEGRHKWVVVQGPHETVERWLARAWEIRNGRINMPGQVCEDFECNGDQVHLCIGCMVGEPQEECEERLEEAVALYKRIAGC